jgi:hypothetical protein
MKARVKVTKRTPAQLRKRESALLDELCSQHGYMFADRLPERDRSTMMMRRVGKRTTLELGIALKIIAPAQGALGRMIVKERKKKLAKTRRMRPLAKIGPGPRETPGERRTRIAAIPDTAALDTDDDPVPA